MDLAGGTVVGKPEGQQHSEAMPSMMDDSDKYLV